MSTTSQILLLTVLLVLASTVLGGWLLWLAMISAGVFVVAFLIDLSKLL